MVGWVNNQALIVGPRQGQKCVHVAFKENLLKVWQTPIHVSGSSKKPMDEDMIVSWDCQRGD